MQSTETKALQDAPPASAVPLHLALARPLFAGGMVHGVQQFGHEETWEPFQALAAKSIGRLPVCG